MQNSTSLDIYQVRRQLEAANVVLKKSPYSEDASYFVPFSEFQKEDLGIFFRFVDQEYKNLGTNGLLEHSSIIAKRDNATEPQAINEDVSKRYHIPMEDLVRGENAEKFAFWLFTDYLFANTKMAFYERVLAKSKRIGEELLAKSKRLGKNISISPQIIVELDEGREIILKEIFPAKQDFMDYHTTIFNAEDFRNADMMRCALGGMQNTGPARESYIEDSIVILSALPNTNALIEMSQAKRDYMARRAEELYDK